MTDKATKQEHHGIHFVFGQWQWPEKKRESHLKKKELSMKTRGPPK